MHRIKSKSLKALKQQASCSVRIKSKPTTIHAKIRLGPNWTREHADKEFKFKTCCDTLFFVHIHYVYCVYIYMCNYMFKPQCIAAIKNELGQNIMRFAKGMLLTSRAPKLERVVLAPQQNSNVHEYCRLLAANVSILRMRSKNNLFQLGRP